ncbi:MAG: hypothetical protein ACT4OY_06485 [Alphaproteobacteria bacterium]
MPKNWKKVQADNGHQKLHVLTEKINEAAQVAGIPVTHAQKFLRGSGKYNIQGECMSAFVTELGGEDAFLKIKKEFSGLHF